MVPDVVGDQQGQVLVEAGIGLCGRQVVGDLGMHGVAELGEPEGRAGRWALVAAGASVDVMTPDSRASARLNEVAIARWATSRCLCGTLARPPLWP